MNPQLQQAHAELKKAVKFIWISIGISAVGSLVAGGFLLTSVRSLIATDPEAKSGALIVAIILAFLGMVLSLGISVLLAKCIAKGRNWARWVYLAVAVVGLYTGLGKVSFSDQTLIITVLTIGLYLVGLVLQGYICYLLFVSPARWVFLKDKIAQLESDLKALRGESP